jgi:hypothetical protein
MLPESANKRGEKILKCRGTGITSQEQSLERAGSRDWPNRFKFLRPEVNAFDQKHLTDLRLRATSPGGEIRVSRKTGKGPTNKKSGAR